MELNQKTLGALVALATIVSSPVDAHAYVGPGLGLGVFGTILGAIAAVLLAVVGLVWYPLKRVLGKGSNAELDDETSAD